MWQVFNLVGGLFIAADFLLLWSLNRRTDEGRFLCDFTSQKVWIIMWQVFNLVGVVGLIVALGWFLNLGFWSMLHDPIHFAVFLIICFLLPILLYTSCIHQALYNTLKEAYIDFILTRGRDDSDWDESEHHTDVRVLQQAAAADEQRPRPAIVYNASSNHARFMRVIFSPTFLSSPFTIKVAKLVCHHIDRANIRRFCRSFRHRFMYTLIGIRITHDDSIVR